jgi:hypothetical protein
VSLLPIYRLYKFIYKICIVYQYTIRVYLMGETGTPFVSGLYQSMHTHIDRNYLPISGSRHIGDRNCLLPVFLWVHVSRLFSFLS